MVDFKQVKEAAIQEVQKEQLEKAKKRYKAKLEELAAAQKVVKNIEREITDLEDELSND